MTNFSSLRFSDQLIVMLAVFIVFMAIATMIVVGSNRLKRWFGRRLIGLAELIQKINDKYFSDDEPYDEEWMDEDAWRKTRL